MFGRCTGMSFATALPLKAAPAEESRKCLRFIIREFTILEYVGEPALQMPEKKSTNDKKTGGIRREQREFGQIRETIGEETLTICLHDQGKRIEAHQDAQPLRNNLFA